jgi:hypothetical protein
LTGVILCAASTAVAEKGLDALSISQFDPASPVSPVSSVEGEGIKIGEGTVLHPVFGLQTGFVSNVFYEENAKPAGIMRLLAQVGTSSLGGMRLNPNAPGDSQVNDDHPDVGSFQYLANVRLAYDQPLSGNDTVTGTGGLNVGARFRGMVNPQGKLSFAFDENFLRQIRASNFETSSNENRDINTMRLTFLYHPPGRSLSGYLYLQNTIDVFESDGFSDELYPDRMDTRVGVHVTWQWLPKTQFFGDVSEGISGGLGDAPASVAKVDSYPLVARAGVATLLTVKTEVRASAGYTNGFYSSGPSYSRPWVEANLSYHHSPLGRLGIGYQYITADSVNANFYGEHIIKGRVAQLFLPFAVMVEPELHFRRYEGITLMNASGSTRDDVIVQVVGGIHYMFRNWIEATVDYKFSTVQTDFTYMEVGGQTVELNYYRHELLAGLRIAM